LMHVLLLREPLASCADSLTGSLRSTSAATAAAAAAARDHAPPAGDSTWIPVLDLQLTLVNTPSAAAAGAHAPAEGDHRCSQAAGRR
jgi:hypothetical protein